MNRLSAIAVDAVDAIAVCGDKLAMIVFPTEDRSHVGQVQIWDRKNWQYERTLRHTTLTQGGRREGPCRATFIKNVGSKLVISGDDDDDDDARSTQHPRELLVHLWISVADLEQTALPMQRSKNKQPAS